MCISFIGNTFGSHSSNDSVYVDTRDYFYDSSSALDYEAFANMQADSYKAYSNNSGIGDMIIDGVSNAVGSVMGAGGSKSESSNYISAPSFPKEDIVVSESESLTTETSNTTTQKLVYTADVDIETKDMDNALDSIKSVIVKYNGIIEREDLSNMGQITYDSYYRSNKTAYAYIYVRVPQENYDVFLDSLEDEEGSIVIANLSKSVSNMTEVYYDTASRLRSLRVQEERLFEFMKGATTVSEMLDVEDRLTDVQYEIDSATNTMAEIDYDVQYSTVKLNIAEVLKYTEREENPKNFVERLWSYIKGSTENFLDNVEELLEGLIYAVPNLALWVVIYIVVSRIFKKIWKKRKDKKALEKDIDDEIE